MNHELPLEVIDARILGLSLFFNSGGVGGVYLVERLVRRFEAQKRGDVRPRKGAFSASGAFNSGPLIYLRIIGRILAKCLIF